MANQLLNGLKNRCETRKTKRTRDITVCARTKSRCKRHICIKMLFVSTGWRTRKPSAKSYVNTRLMKHKCKIIYNLEPRFTFRNSLICLTIYQKRKILFYSHFLILMDVKKLYSIFNVFFKIPRYFWKYFWVHKLKLCFVNKFRMCRILTLAGNHFKGSFTKGNHRVFQFEAAVHGLHCFLFEPQTVCYFVQVRCNKVTVKNSSTNWCSRFSLDNYL